jgi:hypothetical protein
VLRILRMLLWPSPFGKENGLGFHAGCWFLEIQGPTERLERGLDAFYGINCGYPLSGTMGLVQISDLEEKEMLASSVKLDEISRLELKKNIDPSHFSLMP